MKLPCVEGYQLLKKFFQNYGVHILSGLKGRWRERFVISSSEASVGDGLGLHYCTWSRKFAHQWSHRWFWTLLPVLKHHMLAFLLSNSYLACFVISVLKQHATRTNPFTTQNIWNVYIKCLEENTPLTVLLQKLTLVFHLIGKWNGLKPLVIFPGICCDKKSNKKKLLNM